MPQVWNCFPSALAVCRYSYSRISITMRKRWVLILWILLPHSCLRGPTDLVHLVQQSWISHVIYLNVLPCGAFLEAKLSFGFSFQILCSYRKGTIIAFDFPEYLIIWLKQDKTYYDLWNTLCCTSLAFLIFFLWCFCSCVSSWNASIFYLFLFLLKG